MNLQELMPEHLYQTLSMLLKMHNVGPNEPITVPSLTLDDNAYSIHALNVISPLLTIDPASDHLNPVGNDGSIDVQEDFRGGYELFATTEDKDKVRLLFDQNGDFLGLGETPDWG